MKLSPLQQEFIDTLHSRSLATSCLFDIDSRVGLIMIQTHHWHEDCNWDKFKENALGWLKVQDKQGNIEHEEIIATVEKVFDHFIANAFDCNYVGIRGKTPEEHLFKAIEDNNPEIVRYLINLRNIDPNAYMEGKGETPLTEAAQFGHVEIVKILLEDPRVDPNKPSEILPFTPIYHAVFFGHIEVVRALLMHPKLELHEMPCKVIDILTLSVFQNDKEVLDLLSQDKRTNLFETQGTGEGTPIENIVQYGTPTFKKIDTRKYKVNPDEETSSLVAWKTLSFIPVSNDKEHAPPDDFADNLQLIGKNHFKNDRHGELYFEYLNEYTRVIYRTHDYVALSMLRRNYPVGPTFYKKKSVIVKGVQEESKIWQIANHAIHENPAVLHEILKYLEKSGWTVFRALKKGFDDRQIQNNKPLKARGTGTNIAVQVRGKKTTGLISASTAPMAKFVSGSGGYVVIFTRKGARLFLDFRGAYPKFISHSEVMNGVRGDQTLEKRAKGAKECQFAREIPLGLVGILDGGYPSKEERTKKEKTKKQEIPDKIVKFLEKNKITLSEEKKNRLLKTKGMGARKKLLLKYCEEKKKAS